MLPYAKPSISVCSDNTEVRFKKRSIQILVHLYLVDETCHTYIERHIVYIDQVSSPILISDVNVKLLHQCKYTEEAFVTYLPPMLRRKRKHLRRFCQYIFQTS